MEIDNLPPLPSEYVRFIDKTLFLVQVYVYITLQIVHWFHLGDRGHGKFLKEITLRQPEERDRVLFGHVIDLDLFESEEQEKLKRLLAGLEESCERADDEMRWNLYVNFDRLGWEDVFDYLTGSGLVLVTAKPAHI
ncbi:uncharacterized protein RSE6_13714 [Rhynchosporium secalis]|uniref:Uncharacterized protein n=1 Tax=Rhynchosporium secalis TaxID=38038 RepID=A0A1E1MTH1_RHYSE|nr:uncharacterized protein RSE6_13714 [Rhynchosporium secalis]